MNIRLSGNGFTIVEIMITVAVVGIITAIGFVAYTGIDRRGAVNTMMSDLKGAYDAMEIHSTVTKGVYPNILPPEVPRSDRVSLSLLSGGVVQYLGLTDVQNAVLMHEICGELVEEGYGRGTNNGGTMEVYISGCNVYNNDRLDVNNSWSPASFTIPVSSTALLDKAESLNYTDSWRPNRTQIEKDFYTEWHNRFVAIGGVYPITSFWDPWCTGACSWGIQKNPLPPLQPAAQPEGEFCVEATYQGYNDLIWHITSVDGTPEEGGC